MNNPERQANPFDEDIPVSRPGEISFGPLRTIYTTVENQFFLALRRDRERLPHYIVLGAPGAGKTSLLRALRHRLGAPQKPWRLPEVLPLPLQIDVAATLSRSENTDGPSQMEFVPERFYAQIQRQLLPVLKATSVIHPSGVKTLSERWTQLLIHEQSDNAAQWSTHADMPAHAPSRSALQQLCDSMALEGLPVGAPDNDDPAGTDDLAAHMSRRYTRDNAFCAALERALSVSVGGDDTASAAMAKIDAEAALPLLNSLCFDDEDEFGTADREEAPCVRGKEYADALARIFRMIWVPGSRVRYLPIILIDGLDAFIQSDAKEPETGRILSRVRNPWDVVKALLWVRSLHESSGAGAVTTSRMGRLSINCGLGPGGTSLTDLALELRIEPSPSQIPTVLTDVLENWKETALYCSPDFLRDDILAWICRESGGVPGIAKRLSAALWDELQNSGYDMLSLPMSLESEQERALDVTYEALRTRLASMIAAASNAGYERPLELLAKARSAGTVSAETPGVRSASLMGLLVPTAQGDYRLGIPGLLRRNLGDARGGVFGVSRQGFTASRSEQALFDLLHERLSETVTYKEVAEHLVGANVWTGDVLESSPGASSRLANRVAVLTGRLRRRLTHTGFEIAPVRGQGYVMTRLGT